MATSVARGTHGEPIIHCGMVGAQTQTLWQIVMQREPFLLMVQFFGL